MSSRILVSSGTLIDLRDPRPEFICLTDIATALSRLCRFTGHTSDFYSVAQHAVLVSRVCAAKDAKWGLLHDAAEAYLGDVSTPLKRLLPEYARLERRWLDAIAERFSLPSYRIPPSVDEADRLLLNAELGSLFPPGPWQHIERSDLVDFPSIEPLSCDDARIAFLQRAVELGLA